MKSTYFFMIGVLLLLIPINTIYGENYFDDENIILITQSDYMNEIIFDGKWTFYTEWKNTSWNKVELDNNIMFHLRSAHQGTFIYFMLDVVSDKKPDYEKDKGIICIDSKNNKNKFFDEDDFCFVAKLQESNFLNNLLDKKNGIILQSKTSPNTFEELDETMSDGFIGIGTMSDDEDRYSSIPHASYEFRIPTELIGRADNYGLYVGVYDSDLIYTWPEKIKVNTLEIPSPSTWGNIISPDKSLPEFEFPLLVILSLLATIIIFFRLKMNKISGITR